MIATAPLSAPRAVAAMPSRRRLLDLSVTLEPSPAEVVPVAIERITHAQGGAHLAELVAVNRDLLPEGLAWASERVNAVTHSGTHLDAPYHYAPTCGGRPARTVDELPLEWFWGRGVKIDVSQGEGDLVEIEEILAFEGSIGRALAPGDIVLFRTGAEEFHGCPEFPGLGRGLAPEVVRLLVERGVRTFGTDAWSIDPPIPRMKDRAAVLGADSVWAAHYVGRELEFCVLERLTNLALLPADGFEVSCFPVKIAGASAGWVRAVAFLPQDGSPSSNPFEVVS